MKFKLFILLLFTVGSSVAEQNTVLLQDGDLKITTADVNRYILSSVPKGERGESFLSKPSSYKEMLSNIYVIKSLASKAKSEAAISEEEINAIAEFEIERAFMRTYLERKVNEKLDAVDWVAKAKEYYSINKSEYEYPEDVSVSHILLSNETIESNPKVISTIKRRISEGENFEALAQEYSDDASVEANSGDLGFIGHGKMVLPFQLAAYKLESVGDYSEPVRTRFGLHIIKLNERKPGGHFDFARVEEKIVKQLRESVENKTRKSIIVAVRSSTSAKVNETEFDSYIQSRTK